MSISQYFQVISEKFKKPINVEEALKYHADTLADFDETEAPLYTGIIEVLKELSKRYKLGLATASPKIFKDAVLQKYNLNFFIISLADEEVEKGKPDPEIYLKAASLLGTQPKQCVVVEDSRNGIKAAHAAGMKVIAHKGKHNIESDLSEADYEVKSLLEIPKILEGLNK